MRAEDSLHAAGHAINGEALEDRQPVGVKGRQIKVAMRIDKLH